MFKFHRCTCTGTVRHSAGNTAGKVWCTMPAGFLATEVERRGEPKHVTISGRRAASTGYNSFHTTRRGATTGEAKWESFKVAFSPSVSHES